VAPHYACHLGVSVRRAGLAEALGGGAADGRLSWPAQQENGQLRADRAEPALERRVNAAPSPRCKVVRAVDVEGPKGGNIRVLILACGARTWRRSSAHKPPPEIVACTSCWVEQRLKAAGI
jgi:hypothetical protein